MHCQPMKPNRSASCCALLWGAGLVFLLGVAPCSHGAPPKAPVTAVETNAIPAEETAFPQSEFDERGGKDPFYPNRILTPTIKTDIKPSEASKYVLLNGLYGTASRPLCTINGRPFEVGEEGEVNTPAGKLKIRCIEIRKDSVVVEVVNSRERKELHLRGGP